MTAAKPNAVTKGEVLDPGACEELFRAVIGLAIKDLEQIEALQGKPSLSVYEQKQLLQLTGDEHPAAVLDGDWFEMICAMLDVRPETVREGLATRRASAGDGQAA